MKSQICDILDIEFPLVAFSHCRDVVAAVSKAGGMGVLGAVGLTPEKLEIELKLFLNSVDRVASVSLDKKDGVKFNLSKDTLDLSVNNTNSGDGKETLSVKFDHDLEISFNSRYLIDVASQLDGDRVEIFFNDTGSPALIKDPGDFDSIFVVMPMKG